MPMPPIRSGPLGLEEDDSWKGGYRAHYLTMMDADDKEDNFSLGGRPQHSKGQCCLL